MSDDPEEEKEEIYAPPKLGGIVDGKDVDDSEIEGSRAETADFLKKELRNYHYPVLNVSFGKDSLCMLHLTSTHKLHLPIVSYMHPYYPRKYRFALGIADDLDRAIFNYPPYRISMMYGRHGEPALVEEFQTSPMTTTAIPIDIIEYQESDDEPKKYRCGLDLLTRPTGTYTYPWDVAIIGHKDCDSDTIYGDVPLVSRVLYRDVGPDCLFPLKEWSHDDVWDYLDYYGIEVQSDRYDRANRREWEDKRMNPDWFEACVRCVDRRKRGQKVFCPKVNREIANISEGVQEFTQQFDYFGKENT